MIVSSDNLTVFLEFKADPHNIAHSQTYHVYFNCPIKRHCNHKQVKQPCFKQCPNHM